MRSSIWGLALGPTSSIDSSRTSRRAVSGWPGRCTRPDSSMSTSFPMAGGPTDAGRRAKAGETCPCAPPRRGRMLPATHKGQCRVSNHVLYFIRTRAEKRSFRAYQFVKLPETS